MKLVWLFGEVLSHFGYRMCIVGTDHSCVIVASEAKCERTYVDLLSYGNERYWEVLLQCARRN